MSTSKELKARAKASLKGKYWNAFLASIVFGLIASISAGFGTFSTGAEEFASYVNSGAIEMDEFLSLGAGLISALGTAALAVQIFFIVVLDGPMEVGYRRFYLKNTEEKPSIGELFFAFKNSYMNNLLIMILAAVKNALWYFVLIIPGIVKKYEYSIIPYILADHPEMSSEEAFAEAKSLMNGNKMRRFMLDLSFIGWFLVCCLTLGIGIFFLIPYYDATLAEFYKEIKNNR